MRNIIFIIVSLLLFNGFSEASEKSNSVLTDHELQKYKGISTIQFSSIAFYPKRNSPAKVEAINISKIPAEITAKVLKINVKLGDRVEKGTELVNFDCADYNSQTEQSLSKLNISLRQLNYERKELQRSIKVAKNNSLSESEVDRRKTIVDNLKQTIRSDQATLAISQNNEIRCIVKAPFSGLVTQRFVNEGEMAAIGSPLVELVQTSNMEVSANISISDLSALKLSTHYTFQVNDEVFPVKLRTVYNFISNNSRSQNARFEFTENNYIIGATGRLQWLSPYLHIPSYLLSKRNGKNGIFVVKNSKAIFIAVEDAEEGRPFRINLAEETQIIIDGRHALDVNQKLIKMKSSPSVKDKR